MKSTIIAFLFFINASISAQTIKVLPYLQDVTPTSVYILWETTFDPGTEVHWGLSESLGNITSGNSFTSSDGISKMHEVFISGLIADTKYYYKVKTGNTFSSVYRFKTNPAINSEKPFTFVAVSDTQFDGDNPNKFYEINHDGILKYFSKNYGPNIEDNLGLILTVGDLVNSGNTYSEWENYYFKPARDVLQYVGNYPILGNHESNSVNYFNYFHLPENGPTGYTEHTWYKDYSNVRFIGMDSNNEVLNYTTQAQLDWLKNILIETEGNQNIDFVVLELHHPFKSELWTPGEIPYTGQVISLLENFTKKSGKPSFHLFGHTHAYSRGQSKDTKHFWMNVATGSGNIDYWGEFTNNDYNEFTVSQDEWGFVVFDVTAGDNPKISVKRISRGNETQHKDNVVTDSFTVYKNAKSVTKPEAISPINDSLLLECVELKASDFFSISNDSEHAQSNWQISTSKDFSNPVFESWKNFENWYNNANTQTNDDLTDEKISGLNPITKYWWRVRYRDKEFNWSEWSEPVSFNVTNSAFSSNLLINPGAESGITGWTIEEGTLESLALDECGCVAPHSGLRLFVAGGLCNDYPVGRATQKVDVSQNADIIDSGTSMAYFGAYMRDWNGNDIPQIKLYFYSSTNSLLGESGWLSHNTPDFTLKEGKIKIPKLTRTIKFEIKGVRNAGSDNDSYIDDIYLRIGNENVDCNIVSVKDEIENELNIYPNPGKDIITIESDKNIRDIKLFNIDGSLIKYFKNVQNKNTNINIENLNCGIYILKISLGNGKIQNKKFVKQ